jgi:hypothetical protein
MRNMAEKHFSISTTPVRCQGAHFNLISVVEVSRVPIASVCSISNRFVGSIAKYRIKYEGRNGRVNTLMGITFYS